MYNMTDNTVSEKLYSSQYIKLADSVCRKSLDIKRAIGVFVKKKSHYKLHIEHNICNSLPEQYLFHITSDMC